MQSAHVPKPLFGKSKTYYNGKIRVRYSRAPNPKEPLLLFAPGGPGLSSNYIVKSLNEECLRTLPPIALMDLPNHDESRVSDRMDYMVCVETIGAVATELFGFHPNLILAGHSFGARAMLDAKLLCREINDLPFIGISLPSSLESSAHFAAERAKLQAPEVLAGEKKF